MTYQINGRLVTRSEFTQDMTIRAEIPELEELIEFADVKTLRITFKNGTQITIDSD